MKTLEIYFWKVAIYLIKKSYNSKCESTIAKDNGECMYYNNQVRLNIKNPEKCDSCKSIEIIEWINRHINTI